MTDRATNAGCLCSAVVIGLAVSSGYPVGLGAASFMPIACLLPTARKWAAANDFGYYAAGTWPMMPGLHRYFGFSCSVVSVFLIWIASSLVLSLPWVTAWASKSRSHLIWRVLFAQIAVAVPPLRLIGFASPLAGAGVLFPGTGWLGLLATAIVPVLFLAYRHTKLGGVAVTALLAVSVFCNLLAPLIEEAPQGWEAVNTSFGDLSRPLQEYAAAEWIQQTATASSAQVLVFPETVVPRWSESTVEFWRGTLSQCKRRGQTLALGAGLLRHRETSGWGNADQTELTVAIRVLKSGSPGSVPAPLAEPKEDFDNTVMLLGAGSGVLLQRIPVPIGMWQPFQKHGVPLHLDAPGVIALDGQRAAVLICYEQLLPYPVLASMTQRPTVLVGISNMHWFADTTLPRYQESAIQAWARLFRLPYLRANNF